MCVFIFLAVLRRAAPASNADAVNSSFPDYWHCHIVRKLQGKNEDAGLSVGCATDEQTRVQNNRGEG